MRVHGMDEHKIAKTYAFVLTKLKKSDGEGKLLVDVLEKITRVLEPPRPAAPSAPPDGPVAVNLIHFASRPARPEKNS